MGVLGAIVRPQPLLMRAGQAELPESRSVGAELVGRQQFRHEALFPEELAHQPERRALVASVVLAGDYNVMATDREGEDPRRSPEEAPDRASRPSNRPASSVNSIAIPSAISCTVSPSSSDGMSSSLIVGWIPSTRARDVARSASTT
jgi:hypothetical protein